MSEKSLAVGQAGPVPLDLLRRYLSASNWHTVEIVANETPALHTPTGRALVNDRPRAKRNFDVYVSDLDDLQGIELVVPRARDSAEDEMLIGRVLLALSAVEDRPEEVVAAAIRQIGFDVIRSRIPDLHVRDDTVHLSIAQSYVSGIRDVLAAAATTELNPAPFFLRLRKGATDYADSCRFGHTFRGSFGFTIESPIEPNIQPALPGLSSGVPFERRVVRRLVRGLSAVADAASQDATAPIVSSSREGFSANICEQLARLVEDTSHTALTFEFAFSPEWPTPDNYQTDQAFRLGQNHIEVIKAAARELRAQAKSWDETVFGRVIRLASEVDPSDLTDVMGEREVAILWSSEKIGDVTVRAALSPADYLAALDAHATGRPVEVSGTLERRGRRWVLSEPKDFKG